MAYQFPSNPSDGDQVFVPSGDGFNVYQYDAQQNTWQQISNDQISIEGSGQVTTEDVLTVPLNPFNTAIVVDSVDDIINLQNQREINWTIADLTLKVQESQTIQDQRISANELATQDLYSITDDHNTRINANSALIFQNRESIGELEEEIDALAPSLERGEWLFSDNGVAPPSYYAFLDSNTQPTDRFDSASIIYVSTRDANSTTHSFNNHEIGEYLQIFNKEDDGYGLYIITDIDDNSNSPNPFFAFTVDFVRSLISVPKAVGRGRFKFFTIADGDPDAYVLRAGDEMSGTLTIDRPQSDSATNSFVIKGRVNTSGTLVDSVLFKDYRRGLGSNSSDYITYYGSGGGDYEVMNRKAGDNRFVGISNTQTISGTKTFSSQVTLSSATSLDIKGKLQINGTTTSSRFLGTTSTGALEWKSAPTFTQTKANWTQTNTSSASYIQNKPTVVEGSKSGIKITSSSGNYYISG